MTDTVMLVALVTVNELIVMGFTRVLAPTETVVESEKPEPVMVTVEEMEPEMPELPVSLVTASVWVLTVTPLAWVTVPLLSVNVNG